MAPIQKPLSHSYPYSGDVASCTAQAPSVSIRDPSGKSGIVASKLGSPCGIPSVTQSLINCFSSSVKPLSPKKVEYSGSACQGGI